MKTYELIGLLLQCDPEAIVYGSEEEAQQVIAGPADSIAVTDRASARTCEEWKQNPAASRLRDVDERPLIAEQRALLVWPATTSPAWIWLAPYVRARFADSESELGTNDDIDGDDADWVALVPRNLEFMSRKLRGTGSTKIYELSNGDRIVVGYH